MSNAAAVTSLDALADEITGGVPVRTQVALVWALIDEVGRRNGSANMVELREQLDEEIGRLGQMLQE